MSVLPSQDMGQGGFVPLAAVILIERLIFTSSPSPVFHVKGGRWDLLLRQIYGDLVSVFSVQKQAENKAYHFGDVYKRQAFRQLQKLLRPPSRIFKSG